jgi:outer membrane protein OmpA-like peptidoglycan-associated protein
MIARPLSRKRYRRHRRGQEGLVLACVISAAVGFVASHAVLALWPSAPDTVGAARPILGTSPPHPLNSTPTSGSERTGKPTASGTVGEQVGQVAPADPPGNRATPTVFSRGPVHVYFAFDDEELSEVAKETLRPLIRAIEREPALSVQLDGYADPSGDPAYNVELSERRVAAVERHLVENRVPTARIESMGHGVLADRTLTDSDKRRVTATLVKRGR